MALYIFITLFYAIGIFIAYHERKDFKSNKIGFVSALLFIPGFCALIIFFAVGLIVADSSYYEGPIVEAKYPIKSLEDGKETFVLGFSNRRYYCQYKDGVGGYRMCDLSQRSVVIYETGFVYLADSTKKSLDEPTMVRRYKTEIRDKSEWFIHKADTQMVELETQLYVPTNTIQKSYNVDNR